MAGQDYSGGFKLYRYDPNLAANVVFVVLFAFVAAGHIFLLIRKKVWYFISFVLGCTCKPSPVSLRGRAPNPTKQSKHSAMSAEPSPRRRPLISH